MCKSPLQDGGEGWEAAFYIPRWHLQSVGRLCKDKQQVGILLEKAKGKGGSLCRNREVSARAGAVPTERKVCICRSCSQFPSDGRQCLQGTGEAPVESRQCPQGHGGNLIETKVTVGGSMCKD